MKKPQIGMITDHNCMRVTKESVVLNDLGYDLHLISPTLRNYIQFKTTHLYINEERFKSLVKFLDKLIDIWHIHNEPCWFVAALKEVLPKAKIIFDYHDSNYWFRKDVKLYDTAEDLHWYNEDLAVDYADGFIVPSEACRDELKTRTKKPIAVVYPACPETYYTSRQWDVWGGLVSQGGHAGDTTKGINKVFKWRDYAPLYKALQGKIKVFSYSPSFNITSVDEKTKKATEHYLNMGVSMNKFTYHALIDRLGEHTWNLVGNSEWTDVMDVMMPNKLFDAIAAGVPSLVLNAKSAGEFVEKHGIGIYIKGDTTENVVEQILDRWNEAQGCRKTLMEKRRQFTMEKYAGAITKLYTKIYEGK